MQDSATKKVWSGKAIPKHCRKKRTDRSTTRSCLQTAKAYERLWCQNLCKDEAREKQCARLKNFARPQFHNRTTNRKYALYDNQFLQENLVPKNKPQRLDYRPVRARKKSITTRSAADCSSANLCEAESSARIGDWAGCPLHRHVMASGGPNKPCHKAVR